MSNCIGVSGATRESKESADKAADSDPSDPVLLVRAAGGRGCLKQNKTSKWGYLSFRVIHKKLNHMGGQCNIPKLGYKTKLKT